MAIHPTLLFFQNINLALEDIILHLLRYLRVLISRTAFAKTARVTFIKSVGNMGRFLNVNRSDVVFLKDRSSDHSFTRVHKRFTKLSK